MKSSPARRQGLVCAALAVALGATAAVTAAATAAANTNAAAASSAAVTGDLPTEVRTAFGSARLQGQGRLRFLGLRVYEARLWTAAGQSVAATAWAQQPLALEIRYQRALEGAQIADRSLQEMKRQGDLDEATAQRWLQAMKALFPDVREGSRITGLNRPGVGAQFFVDGQLKGAVNEVDFARRFFGIWLAPQSSDQPLRAALLGDAVGPSVATP